MPALQVTGDRTVMNVSLPQTLANKLARLALERGQSRSELIRHAVQQTYFQDTPAEGAEDTGVEGCPPGEVGT